MILRFVSVWLSISFSQMVWSSWYFIILYTICLIGHFQEGLDYLKLILQAAMLVCVALVVGLVCTVGGFIRHYTKKTPATKSEAKEVSD